MEILLANPRGFCAGVQRAIDIVEIALEKFGPPIYVRHEIVHNKFVVENLKNKGAIFVKEINEIPEGSYTIFSAHGVSDKVVENSNRRNLKIIDAACPLVTKVHREAQNNEKKGRQVILIGHQGHPEVEGTSGRIKQNVEIISSIEDVEKLEISDPNNLSYVTQTTLSVDDTKEIISKLKERFPNIQGPDLKDICYATQNRQNAVKELAKKVDLILVIGAPNSSNSNRLRDLGQEKNIISYLIENASQINLEWFDGVEKVGITAGASAPEILVQEVVNYIEKKFGAKTSILNIIEENIKFKLPKEIIEDVFS